jgi:probable non-F420 flavinoid oxidoreductase
MQATSLPFGLVTAPGQRYHPAIVAQAAATLTAMFPGRLWVSMGTGEALNEHITGGLWPPAGWRKARLQESVDVIRALWAGETVTHYGTISVERARLYTRPTEPPAIIGAAVTAETAEWVAGWADGLITVNRPRGQLQEVMDRFRRGGGEGKPMYLQVHLSYAATEERARQGAYEQWRTNVFQSSVLEDLRTPEQFDAAAAFVRPEDLDGPVRISADLRRHVAWLQEDLAMGFDHLYLHNVNREQERFVEDFGAHVLPALE